MIYFIHGYDNFPVSIESSYMVVLLVLAMVCVGIWVHKTVMVRQASTSYDSERIAGSRGTLHNESVGQLFVYTKTGELTTLQQLQSQSSLAQ